MSELKSLAPEILLHVAKTLEVSMKALVATIELLDDGGTVPFIARYRKEATGNLDEVQIRAIEEKLAYFRELEDRKARRSCAPSGAGQTHRRSAGPHRGDARKKRAGRSLSALQAQAADQGDHGPRKRFGAAGPLSLEPAEQC